MRKNLLAWSISVIVLAACGSEQRTNHEATTAQSNDIATTQTAAPATPASASTPAISPEVVAAVLAEHQSASQAASAPVFASAPTAITTHNLPSHRPFVITADLTFRTPDVRKTAVAIEQLALKHGGFVIANQTSSRITRSEQFEQADGMLLMIDNYLSHSDLTVRVPRQNAQAFLHEVQPYITLLENQQFAADDVAAMLQRQWLAAEREQQHSKDLQQLNGQTKAAPADRRATIEAQYAARAQADEAKVQQLELQDKIQFATIHLHFRQPEQLIKHTTPNPSAVARAHRPDFWASVKVSVQKSVQMMLSIFLFIFEIWYVVLGVALLLWWQHKSVNRVRDNHEFEVEEEWEAEPAPPKSRRRKKYAIKKNQD